MPHTIHLYYPVRRQFSLHDNGLVLVLNDGAVVVAALFVSVGADHANL